MISLVFGMFTVTSWEMIRTVTLISVEVCLQYFSKWSLDLNLALIYCTTVILYTAVTHSSTIFLYLGEVLTGTWRHASEICWWWKWWGKKIRKKKQKSHIAGRSLWFTCTVYSFHQRFHSNQIWYSLLYMHTFLLKKSA